MIQMNKSEKQRNAFGSKDSTSRIYEHLRGFILNTTMLTNARLTGVLQHVAFRQLLLLNLVTMSSLASFDACLLIKDGRNELDSLV